MFFFSDDNLAAPAKRHPAIGRSQMLLRRQGCQKFRGEKPD
jgi:hypothetical protein